MLPRGQQHHFFRLSTGAWYTKDMADRSLFSHRAAGDQRKATVRRRPFAAVSCALVLGLGWAPSPARGQDIRAARAELYASYRAKLDDLAQWRRRRDPSDQASELTGWLPKRDPDKLYLFLPRDLPAVELNASAAAEGDAPAADRADADWQTRFAALRRAEAAALFDLAQQAAAGDQADLALELAAEALREDPDHEGARQALGYRRYEGQWRTSYEVIMLGRGAVWSDQFGWLPAADVARYEQGLRKVGREWISADQDAALHADIARGWQVQTDHYRVVSNDSLPAAARLAVRLEQLREAFGLVFPRYSAPGAPLRFLRGATAPVGGDPTHQVVYFHDKDQYVAALKPRQPLIEKTLGIYFDVDRRAYFYAGDDERTSITLQHEATHQLFQETRRTENHVGARGNFWVLEGAAVYMETLTRRGDWWTMGGLDAGRTPAARRHLLGDGFYIPLADLVRMGQADIQQRDDIAAIYSQAAGLVTFLMHYDGGKYRAALSDYLVAIYTGRDNAGTLALLTGTSYEELDQEYRAYMSGGE